VRQWLFEYGTSAKNLDDDRNPKSANVVRLRKRRPGEEKRFLKVRDKRKKALPGRWCLNSLEGEVVKKGDSRFYLASRAGSVSSRSREEERGGSQKKFFRKRETNEPVVRQNREEKKGGPHCS